MNGQQRTYSRRCFSQLAASSLFLAALASVGLADEANDAGAPFTFGVIADAQYCDAATTGTRFYRHSLEKLTACVEDLNQRDPVFVIHLGDFIDRDFASFDAVQSVFNRLEPTRYYALGNHDFSVAADKKDKVPEKLGMAGRYYSFNVHGWRFLVLDGNDLSLISRQQGEPEYQQAQAMLASLKQRKAPNAQSWNGGLGKTQFKWLADQLIQADREQQRAVVFCHFPVYPRNAHNLWNDAEVIQLLESHSCVAAYMNGHNHAGAYAVKEGIHYVTFQGMVETKDTSAYALVRVQDDKLHILGQGRIPSRVLE